jgi:hypothetical protein
MGFSDGGLLKIDLAAVKQKGKAKAGSRAQGSGSSVVEIELRNVEKANLVAET